VHEAILDVINNCFFHPNLDGQFHPLLDVYCVILPSIEKSIKKHPFLDELDVISQIIQKRMIVGHQ